MENLQERLKSLRTARNLRQKDVASSTGISPRMYQYYEMGTKEPTMSKLIALADFFDVSVDYLVGRTDRKEVNQ